MALRIVGIILDELASDPGSPVDGQFWYNTTTDTFKARQNGATIEFQNVQALVDHVALSNPHNTTLEDARTAGNTLSGDVDVNGNRLLNVGGSAGTDGASRQYVVDQVNSKLRGLDWQESVLDRYDPTTALPPHGAGDRYISTATANGWTQHYIYESDGASWTETIPDEGAAALVEDEDILYIFNGTTWGSFGSAIDHGALVGLTDIADHPGYLDLAGARPMTGDLDTNGNDIITGAGLVDGVDVSDHSARHDPGGADALTTAAPLQGVGGGNSEGTATSFSRSDHDHKLRTTEGGGTDLAIASIADGEFLRRSGTNVVGDATPGFLIQKSGRVLAASFSGNPKKATVTFSAAMPSTNYSVQLTPESSTKSFAPSVETKTTGGFTINTHANSIVGLDLMGWLATVDGETS